MKRSGFRQQSPEEVREKQAIKRKKLQSMAKKPKTPLRASKINPKPFKAKKASKSLKRVGKVGKANLEANKLIKQIVEYKQINYCEMRLPNCLLTWPLQIAHKHKRAYYKGEVAKLADYKEWVIACQNCHNATEWNRELNDEIFNRLRP